MLMYPSIVRSEINIRALDIPLQNNCKQTPLLTEQLQSELSKEVVNMIAGSLVMPKAAKTPETERDL